jgi:hypothetical protein
LTFECRSIIGGHGREPREKIRTLKGYIHPGEQQKICRGCRYFPFRGMGEERRNLFYLKIPPCYCQYRRRLSGGTSAKESPFPQRRVQGAPCYRQVRGSRCVLSSSLDYAVKRMQSHAYRKRAHTPLLGALPDIHRAGGSTDSPCDRVGNMFLQPRPVIHSPPSMAFIRSRRLCASKMSLSRARKAKDSLADTPRSVRETRRSAGGSHNWRHLRHRAGIRGCPLPFAHVAGAVNHGRRNLVRDAEDKHGHVRGRDNIKRAGRPHHGPGVKKKGKKEKKRAGITPCA